jgi:hypothetical protein
MRRRRKEDEVKRDEKQPDDDVDAPDEAEAHLIEDSEEERERKRQLDQRLGELEEGE